VVWKKNTNLKILFHTIASPVPKEKGGSFGYAACVLNVVVFFFDTIVYIEANFDFSQCRYFLGQRITHKIGDSYNANLGLFDAIS